MRKLIFSIFLLFATLGASAQINLGGYITTIGQQDTYPTHLDTLGMGGYMTTFNHTTRNAIPAARRKKGMLVTYASNPDSSFRLVGGILNTNWVYTPLGGNGILVIGYGLLLKGDTLSVDTVKAMATQFYVDSAFKYLGVPSNGLTNFGDGTFGLGGTLNQTTDIAIGSNPFTINDAFNARFIIQGGGSGVISASTSDPSTGAGASFSATTGAASLGYSDASSRSIGISVGDYSPYGHILVTDAIDYKGIQGHLYYGANYDSLTYVQKKYVDSLFSHGGGGGSYLPLTFPSNQTVDLVNHQFSFHDSSNPNNLVFSVNATSGISLGIQNGASAPFAQLDLALNGNSTLGSNNGLASTLIETTPTTSIIAEDDNNHVGIKYYGTYNSTDPKWLPPLRVVDSLIAAGSGSALTFQKQVWVETSGNDGTGQINNPSKPFLTVQAAVDAILPDTSTRIKVNIGIGTFTTPILHRGHITFSGSGRPTTDAKYKWLTATSIGSFLTLPTKLVGGTIMQGRFLDTSFSVIRLEHLGIDVGSAWCTASNGGNPTDAIFICQRYKIAGGYPSGDGEHQLQTNYAQFHDISEFDIAAICQNSTAAVHANLIENCYNPSAITVYTYYGSYGTVWKSVGGTLLDYHGAGHSAAGLCIKNNDYATSWGVLTSDIHIRNIHGYDSGGIYLLTENSLSLEFPRINGFQIDSTSYGIKTSAVVDGANISNGTIFGTQGRAIYLDPSFAFGNLSNIDIRSPGDTAVYFTQAAGSLRRTTFDHITVSGGAKIGWYLNQTSSSIVDVLDCSSISNGGVGYNIAGNIYNGGGTGIYTLNNVGGAGSGAFIYTASGTSDPIVTIGTDGNLRKSTILLSQFNPGGDNLNTVTTRGATTANAITLTGKLIVGLNEGLAIGTAGTEQIHFGNNGDYATNRNIATGTLDVTTGGAYNWAHTKSTTNTLDYWALGAYGSNAVQTTATAFVINAAAMIGIGANSTTSWLGLHGSSTAASSFNVPTGTAPTTPVSGDFWRPSATVINYYDGTSTQTIANLGATQTFANTKSFTTGFNINGSSSGVISFVAQSAAGTYNLNFPNTLGTAGQVWALGATPSSSAGVWITPAISRGTVTISSASSLTAVYGNDYVFTGTTSTYTMPAISTSFNGSQYKMTFKNRGSGNITFNSSAGANDFYTTSAVATFTLAPGASCALLPDGTLLDYE